MALILTCFHFPFHPPPPHPPPPPRVAGVKLLPVILAELEVFFGHHSVFSRHGLDCVLNLTGFHIQDRSVLFSMTNKSTSFKFGHT